MISLLVSVVRSVVAATDGALRLMVSVVGPGSEVPSLLRMTATVPTSTPAVTNQNEQHDTDDPTEAGRRLLLVHRRRGHRNCLRHNPSSLLHRCDGTHSGEGRRDLGSGRAPGRVGVCHGMQQRGP